MIHQITSKLELNLLNQRTSPEFVCDFAIKHRIPAIVIPPDLVAPVLTRRMIRSGQFKIIVALDFPNGKNFAMDKLYRNGVSDLVSADGFEILLTPGRTQVENLNEMKALYQFIKMHNQLTEIRWVISGFTTDDEQLVGILENTKKHAPSYVRIDSHLQTPKASLERQKELVNLVSSTTPYAIKVSGNVGLDTIEALVEEKNVKRFDVSLKQAEALVHEAVKRREAKRDAPALPGHTENRTETSDPVQSGASEPKFL